MYHMQQNVTDISTEISSVLNNFSVVNNSDLNVNKVNNTAYLLKYSYYTNLVLCKCNYYFERNKCIGPN